MSAPAAGAVTIDNTLTGANLGTGTGLIFSAKSGAALQLNSLLAGAGLTVSAPSAGTITLTNTSLNTAVAITSAGGTQTLIGTATAPTFTLKGLSVPVAVGGRGDSADEQYNKHYAHARLGGPVLALHWDRGGHDRGQHRGNYSIWGGWWFSHLGDSSRPREKDKNFGLDVGTRRRRFDFQD